MTDIEFYDRIMSENWKEITSCNGWNVKDGCSKCKASVVCVALQMYQKAIVKYDGAISRSKSCKEVANYGVKGGKK